MSINSNVINRLDDIEFPDHYVEKYRNFVYQEANKSKRFIIDRYNCLYLTGGNGTVKEVTADDVSAMGKSLDRHGLITLWETSPVTYHIVAKKRTAQLIVRNAIVGYEFVPNVLEIYPNLIDLKRALPKIPLYITLESVVPVLYNADMMPSLIYDQEANILYSADGKRGVFGKVIEEVRKLLTN